MSEDIKGIKENVRELFNSRNDHDVRLGKVELNIDLIRTEQTEIRQDLKDYSQDVKNYHDNSMNAVEMIRSTISEFIKDINGIPNQNKEAIVKINENCIPTIQNDVKELNKTVWQWTAVISFVILMITFYLAYKQINKTEPVEIKSKITNKEVIESIP